MKVINVLIFEGIAILTVDDREYDAYMSIRTEAVGQTIRWFGSFTWMGEGPPEAVDGKTLDVVLSDGREGKIRVPHLPADHETWEFLGIGVPPGFEWFGVEPVIAELAEVKIPRWRVWFSRLAALGSLAAFLGAIWWRGHGWDMFLTGCLLGLVSVHLSSRRAGKQLPEVPLDVPR